MKQERTAECVCVCFLFFFVFFVFFSPQFLVERVFALVYVQPRICLVCARESRACTVVWKGGWVEVWEGAAHLASSRASSSNLSASSASSSAF